MTDDGRPAREYGLRFWQVHSTHRRVIFRVVRLLGLLALIQFVAWAIPSPPGATGVRYYLPLHELMETVSIVIAMMVFAVGWNSHGGKSSGNLVLLACLFFSIAWLDFFHTASYGGMPDFVSPNDSDKHLYPWMAARFLAAVSLLLVTLRPWDRWISNAAKYALLSALFAATLALNWIVIYHQNSLPDLFIPGQGLTPLKKNLEYLYVAINLVTAALLWVKLRKPQSFNAPLLFAAVCTMAMSEFYFTLYTTMTGAYNVLGHVYKVISYLFIYRAVVVESIDRPYLTLERTRQNLELAVRASNTGLWDWDLQTGQSYYSPVWKAQLGYGEDELEGRHHIWESLLHPDDRIATLQAVTNFLAADNESFFENEVRMRHKDGSYHWILSRGEKQRDASGRAVRLIGSHADMTERKRAEERFRSAVEASPTGMIMVNEQGLIVLTNAQTDTLFGYDAGSLLGQSIEMLIPPPLRNLHAQHMTAFMAHPGERRMGDRRELFARHRDGSEFRVELGLTPIVGHEAQYVLASVVDITSRIQSEQRINQLINFDPLTGLPNRQLLNDRVNQAIHAAQREKRRLAVLFLDLDHFKHVNDTLGHPIGDKLLIEIGQRIKLQVRDSDTVARIGGDEFVVVLTEGEENAAARVASKLLLSVAVPYRIESHELSVTPSIGIAMYPSDGTEFETLYRHADTALYRAKQDGRNDFRFFTSEMNSRTERMLMLESSMQQAQERGQFHLEYQPQLSMDGNQVVGVEALLRWRHPDFGMVSPAEFIPLAESNGKIISIGAWVLRSAVQQLKCWLEAGLPPMVMAVNLSAVQFRHVNLPKLVTQILLEEKLAPEYLELELTEGVAMGNPLGAVAVMDSLHERGVRMSIDDFGTGYSSLSYLKKFKIYKLKIDQSFVRDIATDADDRAIVNAIIQMAHSLGLKTIAEGVETPAQREFLRQQGCDEVQGYFFSKPLAADRIPDYVSKIMGAATS